jgi:ABC-type uncharacterized transport system substrate-binding protein
MEGEEGGLIAYGPSLVQLYRDIFARQLVRLLRGAKPVDLPIEQPTKFELVINLKPPKRSGSKYQNLSLCVPTRCSNEKGVACEIGPSRHFDAPRYFDRFRGAKRTVSRIYEYAAY